LLIAAVENPVPGPAAPPAANEDHVRTHCGPLALDAKQAISDVEDEVIAPSLHHRPVYADAELGGTERDRQLSDRTLLIRRQHVLSLENISDVTVAHMGNVSQALAATSSFGTSFQRSSSR
jgi:hypothetical protein